MSQEFRMAFGDGVARRLHDERGRQMEAATVFYLDAEALLGPGYETDGARLECKMEQDGLGLIARPERGMELALLPGEWAAAYFKAHEMVERGIVHAKDIASRRGWRVAAEGAIKPEEPKAERTGFRSGGSGAGNAGKPWKDRIGRDGQRNGDRKRQEEGERPRRREGSPMR